MNLGLEVLMNTKIWLRLLKGLLMTLQISLLSVAISCITGVLFGLLMTHKKPLIRILAKGYFEVMRIVPVLVWMFLLYFGLPRMGFVAISGKACAMIVFVLWGTAEMGDLVRGAVSSMPTHQFESGRAIGLTEMQIYRYIIIPQAVRRLLPAAVNLVTRMVKTTTLVVFVGVVEIVKVGQQIIEAVALKQPMAAFWIYGTVFLIYFAVCYPVSRLSKHLEKKFAV